MRWCFEDLTQSASKENVQHNYMIGPTKFTHICTNDTLLSKMLATLIDNCV